MKDVMESWSDVIENRAEEYIENLNELNIQYFTKRIIKLAFIDNVVKILQDVADGLDEIVQCEEDNLSSYYFGIQEHNNLLYNIKALRDNILESVKRWADMGLGNHTNQNEEK